MDVEACGNMRFSHVYTVSQKKLCKCYFLNNSVKQWPILTIFGMQHQDEM